jgi:hypothetical protein
MTMANFMGNSFSEGDEMRSCTIRYDAESIGDIDSAAYAGMVEGLIAEYYGTVLGDYAYDIRPHAGRDRVELHGQWPDDAREVIKAFLAEAFERCLNGEPVPE